MTTKLSGQESSKSIDPNMHVREYLDYYILFPHSPRFAVLINGPWGSGKTHLVKEILKEGNFDNIQTIHISLYGLATLDDIDHALLRGMYPALGWKTSKVAGRATKTVMKFFRVEPEIKISELLSKFSGNLYVFDDLERCEIPISKVMGYINEFVEHDGCKVVIIANEKEIREIDHYTRYREKLIGKVLMVQPPFSGAIEKFLSHVSNEEYAKFIKEKIGDVSSIFQRSELNNLRILQQTLWDFERLFNVLSEDHRGNKEAMTDLVQLFFVFSFEIKAGRINHEVLASRMGRLAAALHSSLSKDEMTPMRVVSNRYPEIDLGSKILSNEDLIDVLTKGVVNKEAIRASVDSSKYFFSEQNQPAWRKLWRWYERTEMEFSDSLAEMEREFEDRKFLTSGEILHVFGIRLWLASIGAISKNKDDVMEEGVQYINDLYIAGKLEPFPLQEGRGGWSDGFDGLQFLQSETEEYKRLLAHLNEMRAKSSADKYPDHAENLMLEMAKDSQLFFRRLCVTDSEDSVYFNIPVLASVDPDIFAKKLLGMHPSDQRIVIMALKARYECGAFEQSPLNTKLSAEKPWLIKVRNNLNEAAIDMSPFGKYRMTKMVEAYITPVLLSSGEIS